MPIIAKASSNNDSEFIPAPSGTHSAVCVDVVDLGILKTSFGGKEKQQHKIYIVWQIAEDMENGKPFIVRKRYTLSLFDKAALFNDLTSWRGKPFTAAELEGFDVETVVGAPCMLSVLQESKADKTYANVKAVSKLPKGMTPIAPRDYVRMKDRVAAGAEPQEPPPFGDLTDEDVPF